MSFVVRERATAAHRASSLPERMQRSAPKRFRPRDFGTTAVVAVAIVLIAAASGRVIGLETIFLLFPVVGVAGYLLPPLMLRLSVALAVTTVIVIALTRQTSWPVVSGIILSLVIIGILAARVSTSHATIGTRGSDGDRMLADLRDRLTMAGQLPPMPRGWEVASCVLPAHGDRYTGDFLVSRLVAPNRLEVMLVDVSGKGTRAGTRALLLAGAFGALLGAVPAGGFLAAANRYVVSQRWDEGFATAVHLDIDLSTGRYSVGVAGNPRPARYVAGRGHWEEVRQASGPALGVLPGSDFPRAQGWLEPGDALLLYSDGVIEAPGRDLAEGVDRMLGIAAHAMLTGEDIGQAVCLNALSGTDDDRAAFTVRRH